MKSASRTDKGKIRKTNQDYLYNSDHSVGNLPNLYIVADGMGGHNAGEFASSFGTQKVVESISNSALTDVKQIVEEALYVGNASVFSAAIGDKMGCGTTMVIAVVDGTILHVFNVGDSRLYLSRKDSIQQITRDHSVVEEMVRRGLITEEEAEIHPDRHKITRAFGIEPSVNWDTFVIDNIEAGDHLLLCSDGVTNMISDEELYEILSDDVEVDEKVDRIVDLANANGGADNITAIVVEI